MLSMNSPHQARICTRRRRNNAGLTLALVLIFSSDTEGSILGSLPNLFFGVYLLRYSHLRLTRLFITPSQVIATATLPNHCACRGQNLGSSPTPCSSRS